MAEEPDRLKQDIERTRASLSRDVDLLAEKTSPRQVARRRWTAVKEKVMGTTEDTRYATRGQAHRIGDKASELSDTASEKASAAADRVREAPQAVARQTQGNPLAAGIIAFGVGLLTASLVPVTDAERRAGQQLKDQTGDLTEKAKDVASDLKDEFGDTVQEAAGQVRETARHAAQTTRETARSDAQEVRNTATP
jgi:gas vesicle protein